MSVRFILNSVLLGVGLAMDAFSVSMANGLREPGMPRRRGLAMAGVYAGFQFIMPVIGWFCVHAVAEAFAAAQRFIPWIGFALLAWIGGKMLFEALAGGEAAEAQAVSGQTLLLQGLATSIDALSVGFAVAHYNAGEALCAAAIIALVTFGLCIAGIRLGRYFGLKLSGGASLLGGVTLILIGLRILFGL